jgi:hypothetical protein
LITEAGSDDMILPFIFENYNCLLSIESRESFLKHQDVRWIY